MHLRLQYLLRLMAGARVVMLAAQQQEGSNRESNGAQPIRHTRTASVQIETEPQYCIVVNPADAADSFVPSLLNRQIIPPLCVLFP